MNDALPLTHSLQLLYPTDPVPSFHPYPVVCSSHIIQCCYPERSSKKLSSKLGHAFRAALREGRRMGKLVSQRGMSASCSNDAVRIAPRVDIQSRQFKSRVIPRWQQDSSLVAMCPPKPFGEAAALRIFCRFFRLDFPKGGIQANRTCRLG